jgi:hypothetical protein
MEGYIPGRRKRGNERGDNRGEDITDELQMSESDAGHLAYDRAIFRRVVREQSYARDMLLNEGMKFHFDWELSEY